MMLAGCTPWPDEWAERYRESGYWQGRTLGDLLHDWARRYDDRVALVHRERRLSYRELDLWADRVAIRLNAEGITAGDRVVVHLPNIPEFVAVCFALFRLGAHPVFALAAHRGNEIRHLCRISEAVAYIVPDGRVGYDYPALAKRIQADVPTLRTILVVGGPDDFTDPGTSERGLEPVRVDPADVAFFLLSGGTTALPKLIPRTHDDYAYQVRAGSELCRLTRQDVYLVVLPIEFNFPWGCPGVLGTLSAGGTVVLAADAGADECFALIARERVTFTSLVPAIAHLWLEEVEWSAHDLSSLRFVQVGGAKLPAETARRIPPAFGCRLQQVFGMAEGMLSYVREDDDEETAYTTQGLPLSPADEVRIVDEHGDPVAPGAAGEMLVRGPYTLRGYYRAPEHNERAFTEDGFYRTGDVVTRTPDGHLVIEGRIKDVVIRGGDKISAPEIEEHLLALPGVHQVALIGVPDPILGERTCACVVAHGHAPELLDLRTALQDEGLADYKLPDRLEILADLPRTPLGKVDKKALVARFS
nr:AMP-binding protein [Embleya scabrispora]